MKMFKNSYTVIKILKNSVKIRIFLFKKYLKNHAYKTKWYRLCMNIKEC